MPKRSHLSLANFSRFPARSLKAALDSLSEAQRKYCTDYYSREMTMKEIAQLYGVNKSTVSRTIARAKRNIARAMKYCNIK